MTNSAKQSTQPITMLSFRDDPHRKIAVVRMLPGLGDFLVIIPALRALRSALPHTSITFVGLEPARQFCRRFGHYFDSFERSPGFPGLPECEPDTLAIPRFLKRMQANNFDLAIQMHGDGTVSNIFTTLLRPGILAGYYRKENYCPDRAHFLEYRERESEIVRYLRLVQSLGFPLQGEELEFPLTKKDRDAFNGIEGCRFLNPLQYVCIHPGASAEAKRWPYQYFAAAGVELASQGWQIVLTGGPAERELCRQIEYEMGRNVLNLAGRTTLGGLAMLLSNTALVICNDTGVSHLASALNIPSVVIFTASDPLRWSPLNNDLHRAVFQERHDEDTNLLKRGPQGSIGFEYLPTVDNVLYEVEALLKPRRRALPDNPLHALAVITDRREAEHIETAIRRFRAERPSVRITVFPIDLKREPLSVIMKLRSLSCDVAVILTSAGQSPYSAAYLCYLAGIPARIGHSLEFGGGVLSRWIKTLPEKDPVDRHLSLLRLIDPPGTRGATPSSWSIPMSGCE